MKKILFIAIACIFALSNTGFEASAQKSTKSTSVSKSKKTKYIGYTFSQLFDKSTSKADVEKRLGKATFFRQSRKTGEVFYGFVDFNIKFKKGLVEIIDREFVMNGVLDYEGEKITLGSRGGKKKDW